MRKSCWLSRPELSQLFRRSYVLPSWSISRIIRASARSPQLFSKPFWPQAYAYKITSELPRLTALSAADSQLCAALLISAFLKRVLARTLEARMENTCCLLPSISAGKGQRRYPHHDLKPANEEPVV